MNTVAQAKAPQEVSFETYADMNQSVSKLINQGRIRLDDKSVAIFENYGKPEAATYIVGSTAINRSEAVRELGTNINNADWLRYIAARLVLSLGAGNHKVDLSLIATSDSIALLTGDQWSNEPTEQTLTKLQEHISAIYFATEYTTDQPKKCSVELSSLKIISELDAVTAIIPSEIRKAILVQCGHGDTQMTLVQNGDNGGIYKRQNGLIAPFNTIGQILKDDHGISKNDLMRGWNTNLVEIDSIGTNKMLNIEELKHARIKTHYEQTLGALVQDLGDEVDAINGVIVSGGAVNDPIVLKVITDYFARQNKKVFTIDSICNAVYPNPLNSGLTNSTSAVFGALSMMPKNNEVQLAMDAGNGWSKSALRIFS
ncbi:hypothetical protein [Photobacterium leiognathi]|uniref:hypothetical protein n=1 Tax=Photobacterium leiognathi TaxID=553611 RepID=UPI00298257B6|nr:hypothetical protein [Photobacterium leiognathi]